MFERFAEATPESHLRQAVGQEVTDVLNENLENTPKAKKKAKKKTQ